MKSCGKRGRPPGRPRKQIKFAELPDKLIPEDICKFLGIAKLTCYNLLRIGDIPNRRIGRMWIIPKYEFGVKFGFIPKEGFINDSRLVKETSIQGKTENVSA